MPHPLFTITYIQNTATSRLSKESELTHLVYQKVVPPSVFALVVQAMQMSPGGGAPGAGAAGGLPLGVGTGMPAPGAASVADIDDSAPAAGGAASVGSGSGASGADWENVNED